MSAGADQQLIATKLEEAAVKEEDTNVPADNDGRTDLAEGKAARLDKAKAAAKEEAPRPDGELVIHHEKNDAALDEAARLSGLFSKYQLPFKRKLSQHLVPSRY